MSNIIPLFFFLMVVHLHFLFKRLKQFLYSYFTHIKSLFYFNIYIPLCFNVSRIYLNRHNRSQVFTLLHVDKCTLWSLSFWDFIIANIYYNLLIAILWSVLKWFHAFINFTLINKITISGFIYMYLETFRTRYVLYYCKKKKILKICHILFQSFLCGLYWLVSFLITKICYTFFSSSNIWINTCTNIFTSQLLF